MLLLTMDTPQLTPNKIMLKVIVNYDLSELGGEFCTLFSDLSKI